MSPIGTEARDSTESPGNADSRTGDVYIGVLSFLISGFLWGCAIHAVRFVVDREASHPFSESLYLGFGIKLAAWAIVLFLGGLLGPLILAPVFFASFCILARYGKLSEAQAAAAVGLLVALDLAWAVAGLS